MTAGGSSASTPGFSCALCLRASSAVPYTTGTAAMVARSTPSAGSQGRAAALVFCCVAVMDCVCRGARVQASGG